MSFEMERS